MAKLLLGINGRFEAGETLSATIHNTGTGGADLTGFRLQWQQLVGGSWGDVGAANSLSLAIPTGSQAVGRSYRLVATPLGAGDESTTTAATAPVVLDSRTQNAPTLADVTASVTIAEGSALVQLDGSVTFGDGDNANYGGGSLRLAGITAGDTFSLRQTTGMGGVGYDPATGDVSYTFKNNQPPVVIGRVQATLGGEAVVSFNANATVAAVDKVIEALQWTNTSDSADPVRLFTLKVTDPTGAAVQRVIAARVTPVNDAPVADAVSATVNEDGPAVTLAASFTDPDGASDSHTVTVDTAGTVGRVTVNGLAMSYSPDGRFEHLAQGATALDTFTYTVRDAGGLASTRTATVTIVGSNDLATITGATAGVVREDANVVDGMVRASGQLTVQDADAGQASFLPQSGVTTDWWPGTFSITAGGAWTFEASNADMQKLTGTFTQPFQVRSADGTATANVAITWQGVNDAPVIDEAASELTGTVAEPSPLPWGGNPVSSILGGRAIATDVDWIDYGVWTWTGTARYGDFAVPGFGVWNYTIDPVRSQVLRAGEVVQETFTLTVADLAGATDSATVTIEVRGTNDAPEITQADAAGTVTESAPDGRLLLDDSIAGGIYDVEVDAEGRVVIVGQHDDPFGRALWRLNPDGTLDTSFGEGGVRFLEAGSGFEQVALDAAGGAVVAGMLTNLQTGSLDFALARYSGAGTLDTGFGTGGLQLLDFAGGTDQALQVEVLANGQLLVAGGAQADPQSNAEFAMARLNADGSLDTGFGDGGWVSFTRTTESTSGHEALVDAQGRIVVWGETYNTAEGAGINVARYLADGDLDPAFGDGGVLRFAIPWYYPLGADVAVAPDGGVVVAWNLYENGSHTVRLTRLAADGTPDPTFGNGGTLDTGVVTRYGSDLQVLVDGQGRIVLAPLDATVDGGTQPGGFELYRFLADGSFDAGFGTGGHASTGWSAVPAHLRLAADGDILQAGNLSTMTSLQAALARFDANGTLDTTFGGPADEEVYGWIGVQEPEGESYTWTGSAEGTYGTFTMGEWGDWSYRLDNARPATQALSDGDAVTETFVATVTDPHGASQAQTVVVTVVGVTDAIGG